MFKIEGVTTKYADFPLSSFTGQVGQGFITSDGSIVLTINTGSEWALRYNFTTMIE